MEIVDKNELLKKFMEDRVAPDSQQNRTKKVAEDGCPEVFPKTNMIHTSCYGDDFASKLRNKPATD